jgi:hypothetical protein
MFDVRILEQSMDLMTEMHNVEISKTKNTYSLKKLHKNYFNDFTIKPLNFFKDDYVQFTKIDVEIEQQIYNFCNAFKKGNENET